MNQRLIIGNKQIRLPSVGSTNTYLKELIVSKINEPEGTVVVTDNQVNGVGQRGNNWESESGKNLTFSVLLKPNLNIDYQFNVSKFVSIAIIKFLNNFNIEAKIKWPNDIYIDNEKIGGILIENTIRDGKVVNSIVGIGLNINQTIFNKNLLNPTSLKLKTTETYLLEKILQQVLDFVDGYYLKFKTDSSQISSQYLKHLYRFSEPSNFEINGKVTVATIVGVDNFGRLELNVNDNLEVFDLKEIKFLF